MISLAKVKLQIFFKNTAGEEFEKIIGFINPDCADDLLLNFVTELNNLTTNEVKEVFKIVEKFLSESSTDGYITAAELLEIIGGTYTPVADDDPITEAELKTILQGSYIPVADDDALTADDFVF